MTDVKVVLRDAATDCEVFFDGEPLQVNALAVSEASEKVVMTFELERNAVEVVDERSGADPDDLPPLGRRQEPGA